MEKIVVVCDSHKIEISAIDFGCYLSQLTHSALSGILLDNVIQEVIPENAHMPYYATAGKARPGETVVMDSDQAMIYFMEQSRKRGVQSDVTVSKGAPSETVLYESRFADLLVVSPDLTFLGDADDLPSSFVKHLLVKSECPVVLAPHTFEKISQITFCYDGTASSLFAIKQFTYLLPQFRNIPVMLLEVRDSLIREADEGHMRTMSWLKAHYEHVDFHFLQGRVNEELLIYFMDKKDVFIVMGAFGRNLVSNLFRKSTSEKVIKTADLPLFIAHH